MDEWVISLLEIASRFSTFLGQPYVYEEETLNEARKWRMTLGVPYWEVISGSDRIKLLPQANWLR